MNSPEDTNNPEIQESPLKKFEDTLKLSIEKYRKQGLTHGQLKDLTRFYCKQHGEKLGLQEEFDKGLYMYFMRFIYENPDEALEMWKLLYELYLVLADPNSKDKLEKTNEIFENLLRYSNKGITLLWRLVRTIVIGGFDVKRVVIDGEELFYIAIPEDNKELIKRRKDKLRQNISSSIKERVEDRIVKKPLPDLKTTANPLSEQERPHFLRIYQHLQADADVLVSSSTWKEMVDKYFGEVETFLKEIVSKLKIDSGYRIEKYKAYIEHAINSYLNPLKEYCIRMSKEDEANLFAADLLLEPFFIRSRILEDGIHEPPLHTIAGKWKRLIRSIQTFIDGDATTWGMPTIDKLASQTHSAIEDKPSNGTLAWGVPALTDEIPPEMIKAVQQKAAAASKTPSQPETAPTEAETAPTQPEVPPVKPLGSRAPRTKQGAIALAPTEREIPSVGVGGLGGLLKAEKFLLLPEYLEGFSEVEKRDAEFVITDFIRKNIVQNVLKAPMDTKTQNGANKISDILLSYVKNLALTPTLRKFFLSELLKLHSTFQKSFTEKNTQKYLYDAFADVFNELGEQLPEVQATKKLRKKLKKSPEIPAARLLTGEEFESLTSEFPHFSNYENLSRYLEEQGLTKKFQELEEKIENEIIKVLLVSFGSFKLFSRILEHKTKKEDEYILFVKDIEAEIKELLKLRKKVCGNWLTGISKSMKRSPELNAEIQKYFDKYEYFINTIWESAFLPALVLYGKIAFNKE